MANPSTVPMINYQEAESGSVSDIQALERAVRLDPRVAAAVLSAAGTLLASNAWLELGFDPATEQDAQTKLPLRRIDSIDNERDKGRLIAVNVLGRIGVWASRLVADTQNTAA